MPLVYWIFGPNGVGKTTNAQYLTNGVEHFNLDKIIMDLVELDQPGLINKLRKQSVDKTTQDEFLTYFSNNSANGSAELYNQCQIKIKAKEDFSMESNFLPKRNHDILRKAFENGYSIFFIFIGEKSITRIQERVMMRTKLTGQFVSESEIKRRYETGLADINELLLDSNKLDYKNKISEILMLTMPNDKGSNLIIHIQNNQLIDKSDELIEQWSTLVPNLKYWQML